LEKTAKLLQDFPLTPAELEYVVPLTDQTVVQSINGKQSKFFYFQLLAKSNLFFIGQNTHADCLNHYIPVVPPPLKLTSQLEDRKKLPTWTHREEILDLICKNQVILYKSFQFNTYDFHNKHLYFQVIMITGDTGSGKNFKHFNNHTVT
jgi:hypothetical protein